MHFSPSQRIRQSECVLDEIASEPAFLEQQLHNIEPECDIVPIEHPQLRRIPVLTIALVNAQSALRVAETRYRVGSGDLRDIERQQLSYCATRLNLLRVQAERRIQRVNLHLALGGDFVT